MPNYKLLTIFLYAALGSWQLKVSTVPSCSLVSPPVLAVNLFPSLVAALEAAHKYDLHTVFCGNQNQSEEAPTCHAQTQKCVHTLLSIYTYIYVCGIYVVVYISVYLLYICSRSLSLPTSSNMHYLDISIIYSTRIATCSSPPSSHTQSWHLP